MFLSRTVAAEICMEAKTNEHAYMALKRLDKEGILRFELSYVTMSPHVRYAVVAHLCVTVLLFKI